jgi:hypothetical protein
MPVNFTQRCWIDHLASKELGWSGALIADTDKRGPAHAGGLMERASIMLQLPEAATQIFLPTRPRLSKFGELAKTLQVKLSSIDAGPATIESPGAKHLKIDVPNLHAGPPPEGVRREG